MDTMIQFGKVSKEFLLTLFFSLFPILCGSSLSAMWTTVDIKTALSANFSSGEVFIYTSAFLTPYILTRLKERGPNILREFCFYLFLYALGVGAFLFISVRLESMLAISMSVDKELVMYIGYTIVVATLALWYYSIWPNYNNFDPVKSQADEARSLDVKMSKLIDKGTK
ncbi:hypothetical protein ACIPLA_19730 [Pseudomonas sp. NPDC086112]|uniref:hypothetical protein n=1 Tax=Pseudomonas sp. NPDC086112 TaxID=3364430 RepID=UPI0038060275